MPNMSIRKMPTATSIRTSTRAETVETGMPPRRAPAGTSSDMGSAINWKFTNAPPSATAVTRSEVRNGFIGE